MAFLLVTVTFAVYAPGLHGGFIFDDYPNIVDNPRVQPEKASVATLVAAAMSSPSSELKRPLSSLTFAANFLADGELNAVSMKVTNIAIHAANGVLLYFLLTALFRLADARSENPRHVELFAGLSALAWIVLPINLTAVLYVVQRMESLANLFVLLGLLGYVKSRRRMVGDGKGLMGATAALFFATVLGLTAKETAVLLPVYALLLELSLFRFESFGGKNIDKRLVSVYALGLALPLSIGLIWLIPSLLRPETWATRNFTLVTRLLSESRILIEYLTWTVTPLPGVLNFYHDDFVASTGLLHPATTITSAIALAALAIFALNVRKKLPLFSLGIAWYFACHLLTGTILPLELIYEHRNYFASIGIVLAVAALADAATRLVQRNGLSPAAVLAPVLALVAWSTFVTTTTAIAWGSPLSLARELAYRGPRSPRAQYELGRAYIILSRYSSQSPYTDLAYAPLGRAATFPGSSILPEQALIFLNSRMDRPLRNEWWDSMAMKLAARPATVQDESSLDSLSRCLADLSCRFPADRLGNLMDAALNQPTPSGRMLSIAAAFYKRTMHDDRRAYELQMRAVEMSPNEPVYRITLAQLAQEHRDAAMVRTQINALNALNVAGRLDKQLDALRSPAGTRSTP